jgi:hypothetical protein
VTVVRNTIRDAAGQPIAGALARISLVAGPTGSEPGYTADGSVIAPRTVTADQTGLWSTDLPANSTITPAGSYYLVAEATAGQPPAYTAFDVPAAGGPYQLTARILGTLPVPASLYIAATQRGAAGGVATLDGAGQVPLAQLGNTSGLYGAFTSFGSLVNVTLGATVPAGYRNEPGTITRLQGTLVVGVGGITTNTVFANIGAGSRPALIPFVVGVRVTGSGANNFLNVALNGDVSYKAALAAADVIQFDGLTYIHA